MPSTVSDARDLLIASVLSPDPVIFIDDRWLYEQEDELPDVKEIDLVDQKPNISIKGNDITIVSCGHTSLLSREASEILSKENISAEIIDIRVLNPFYIDDIVLSVEKTKIF